MKNSMQNRIREFLASEEGKVGVKAPLTLGVATGSILLAQTIIATNAEAGPCVKHDDCYHTDKCVNGNCVPK